MRVSARSAPGIETMFVSVTLLVAALIVVLIPSPALAASCEPLDEPAFSRAAANDGVVGVVERETLAVNPLPWGASISVATRIWGGIRADRWKVSDRQFESCPRDPASSVGDLEYDFRGAEAEWGDQRSTITRNDGLTSEEALLLETRFGAAEEFESSSVDRIMAVVRMWGFELTALIIAAVVGLVALARRRRRKRLDRTLF